MSEPSENPGQTPAVEKLSQAQVKTEAGQYRDALTIVREAKTLEARNIYILAFEKQVEQLAELSESKLLSDEQRTDILESLPGIIERAAESSNAPAVVPAPDTRAELNREREERAAALEWLKNQYFQHAHDYVRKGEYQHALAEIRRVYIIDPNNTIAKDFEKQIDQLISLRKVQATPRTQSAPSAYPGGGETRTRPEAGGVRTTTAPAETAETGPKKRMSPTMMIAIVLTLIAIAIAFYYFRARDKALRPPAPSQQDVGSLLLTQPNDVAEQSFLISQTEGGGTVSAMATPESAPAQAGASTYGGNFAPPGEGTTETSTQSAEPGPPTRQEAGSPLEEARLVRLARPQLPDGVYATGLEGQVVVQVEIDRDGQPRQVTIVRSTNDLLNRSVIEAIKNSEFAPRKMSDGPVSSRLTIPFAFRTRR